MTKLNANIQARWNAALDQAFSPHMNKTVPLADLPEFYIGWNEYLDGCATINPYTGVAAQAWDQGVNAAARWQR